MTEDELLGRYGLAPAAADLPAIRALLGDHTERERESQGRGDTAVMRLCCALLFVAGDLADVLRIWRAKRASMDAAASIDVQLLCGAGLAVTKEYLAAIDSDEARAAGARLVEGEGFAEFAEFTPAGFVAELARYYGV
jgi:hypothetical protein